MGQSTLYIGFADFDIIIWSNVSESIIATVSHIILTTRQHFILLSSSNIHILLIKKHLL